MALVHSSLSSGSFINFLYCVIVSLVMGWTTPQQYSSMSMTGAYLLACLASELGIVLRGAFNPTPMMWYRACLEMLHGVRLLISRADRHGVVVGPLVG